MKNIFEKLYLIGIPYSRFIQGELDGHNSAVHLFVTIITLCI